MIDALPTPPNRSDDPVNFSTKADAFLAALPTFSSQANALGVDINAAAEAAASSATEAAVAAAAALASANVAKWVSGTTYAEGALSWSPVTYLTYRRKTAGAGTTDPSADSTNWALAVGSGDVTQAGSQTLTNKSLTTPTLTGAPYFDGSVRGNITAVAALAIDCSLGNYFTKTISANSTFTFTNAPASRAYAFTLELTHTSGTVTFPAAVQWPGSVAPSLTTSKTHLFTFVTDDGGTRWRGSYLVDYTT